MHRYTAGLMTGLLSALTFVAAGLAPATAQPQGGPPARPLMMTTTAWEDGGVIPDKYTQVAGDKAVSPEFKWSQVPAGTQSFALLMHDPEPVLNK